MEAIILLRVSTSGQDYEQQKSDLINYSIKLGYTKFFIISDKESAVKLSEEDRNGLNELKLMVMNNPNIKGVFVFEISRLARSQTVLHSMKDWFIKNKINLHIFDKKYNLLNDDYTLNEQCDLLFSLYGYFAESEAKQTKLRTKRGKEYWVAKGKHVGGTLIYGYTTDKDGYIIPNESELKIVKYIFDRFLNSSISARQLSRELIEMGLSKTDKLRSVQCWVSNILKNKAYSGKQSKNSKKELFHHYPMVIPEEMIDRAILKLSKGTKIPRTTDNIYYCKGLLKSKENKVFVANVTDCTYAVRNPHNQVNINVIDSIVWHFVKNLIYPVLLSNVDNREQEKIKEQIEVNNTKLTNFNNKLIQIDKEIKRLKHLYIKGELDDEEYDTMKKEYIKNKAILSNSKQRLEENSISLQQLLKNALKRTGIVLNDIWNLKDDKEIKRIIDECIQVIYVTKNEDLKEFEIITKIGLSYNVSYNVRTKEIIYDNKVIKKDIIIKRFKSKRG